MGFFDRFDFKRKSDAYEILKRYIGKLAPLHGIQIDVKREVYDLLEAACKENPELLTLKLHSASLAAATIAYSMSICIENKAADEANFFLSCLGQMLIDIDSGISTMKFHEHDIKTINGCTSMYTEYAKQLDDGLDLMNN